MSLLTNLDRFFFYIFLPTLTIFSLWGSRRYFKNRQPYYHHQKFHTRWIDISQKLILGGISLGLLFFTITTFIYLYILNIRLIQNLKWEFIILLTMIFLAFIYGVGIGAHIATLTFKMLLPRKQLGSDFQEFKKALNFYHYPFSHKLFYISFLLVIYLLTLLDLFKGKFIDLNHIQNFISLFTGIIMGTTGAVFSIITKTHNTVLKTCLVLLISLLIVSYMESKNILYHPVALLFTTFYATIVLSLLIQKQSRFNLRAPAKRLVKYWFNWDIDTI